MKQNKDNSITGQIRSFVTNQLLDAFRSTTRRSLEKKETGFLQSDLFAQEDLADHFAHTHIPEIASQNVIKGFIIDRIRFIDDVLGHEQIQKDTFADIGDPDGIFLKSFQKDQLSANISKVAVSNVRSRGIEALRCDAEHLPFKTGSIDHILYFEILEHLKNPICALAELHRVAAKSVFISIPFVSRTNILPAQYDPDRPDFEHHVFEFDDEDFRNVVTHAGFRVEHSLKVHVMRTETIRERIIFSLWDLFHLFQKDPIYKDNIHDLYLGCFRKFSIYYLVKE